MNALATIKCPYCRGNTNDSRRTLYLYSTDTYWCARCKKSGLTSEIDPLLLQGLTPQTKSPVTIKQFEYNNQGSRFSVCKERYSDNRQDIFQIKLADGTLVGHYYRQLDTKQSKIEGVKAFTYREQFLQLGATYRLVEGPYDCIYPCDIALLGYPNSFQANQLKWFSKLGQLVLCPDGDVWQSKDNLKRWLEPFQYHKNTVVEYIPKFLDPDECPQDERTIVEFKKVFKWCNGEK